MKIIWEIDDIKAGVQVKKPVDGGGFEYFIIGNYFGEDGMVWGIFHILSGAFVRVGSGIKEAVQQHLNNCGFKPIETH